MNYYNVHTDEIVYSTVETQEADNAYYCSLKSKQEAIISGYCSTAEMKVQAS